MSTIDKEEVKQNASARSNPKRKRSASRMSDVRDGSEPTGDDVRRSRVSRMQRSDTIGKSQDMEEGSKDIRRNEPLSGIERQIAKLNAYRSLLKKKFTLRGAPEDVEKEILKEFRMWVERQVWDMMGRGADQDANGAFTPDEIQALKAMAAKVRGKMLNTPTPKSSPPQDQQSNRPNLDARPLSERSRTRFNALADQDEQLRQLETMDREGPQF